MSERAPGNSRKSSPQSKDNEYWNGHEDHFAHTLPGGEAVSVESPTKTAPEEIKKTKRKGPIGIGLEGDGVVPEKEEPVYGHREGVEGDLGLKDGKIVVFKDSETPKSPTKDPSGEKRVLSFMNESMKDPQMIALREGAAASELAYLTQEGGWRYVVRKASFGKIGGKKLEAAQAARAQANKAWTDKLGEQTDAAIKMAEARAEEITSSIDAKNVQGRKFAKLGLEKTLERYRGRIAHQIVMGEMTAFKQRTGELRQEQWDKSSIFTKGAVNSLAWYNKQPTWKKVAISSALLTGGAAAVGAAGVGVGAIASYGAWRAARAAFSLTAGRVIGEGVAKGAGVITGDKKRAVKRQADIKTTKAAGVDKFKAATKVAVSNYRAERKRLGLPEPTAEEIKKIESTVRTQEMQEIASTYSKKTQEDDAAKKKDRRRSNLVKTLVTGGAGITAFAGAEYLAGGGTAVETSRGKSGSAGATEPDVPPQYPRSGSAGATEPDVPPQTDPARAPSLDRDTIARVAEEMRERQGNTAPNEVKAGPTADTPEDIERYGNTSPHAMGKAPISGAPGEQDNTTGVDNEVDSNSPSTEEASVEDVNKAIDLQPGIDEPREVLGGEFAPKGAPGEQDNVTGIDNAVRQNWNFNGGPKPLASVEDTNKAILETSETPRGRSGIAGVAEPQVARPLFNDRVTVKAGDNLSYIIKDALAKSGHMEYLNPAQQDTLVGKYIAHLKTLSPAELTGRGIPNPSNLDLIQPGNNLDLRLLNEENLYGKFVGEIKGGVNDAPSSAPRPAAATVPTEQAPQAPSPADIQTLSTRIFADQVRDIFSTRAFFFGPRTDGMAEFNRISWQRADTFVGDVTAGSDPTLNGPKAEALRGVLRQAQNGGVNLRNLSIRSALEKAAQLEAQRTLGGR